MDIRGFVICLENDDYPASLELRKIYPVVGPYQNDPVGYLRIIDESGEDYIYPAKWFESVSLGTKLEEKLLLAVST
mgnify:FL=1